MARTPLTERQLQPLMRDIERREELLRRKIAEERARAADEGFAELADNLGDEVDRAFARTRIGIEFQRIDSCLAEIRELAAARERMKHGAFGLCVDCGEAIDYARLGASPAAARCATCQGRYEHSRVLRH